MSRVLDNYIPLIERVDGIDILNEGKTWESAKLRRINSLINFFAIIIPLVYAIIKILAFLETTLEVKDLLAMAISVGKVCAVSGAVRILIAIIFFFMSINREDSPFKFSSFYSIRVLPDIAIEDLLLLMDVYEMTPNPEARNRFDIITYDGVTEMYDDDGYLFKGKDRNWG